jgi:hypothetical protein
MSERAASSLDPIFIPLFLGGIFCLLGLIFFTIGWLRTRMCKQWVPTTGLIVSMKGTTDGWPDRYPTFTWTGPDGRVYRKTSMVHGGLYRRGSQVRVLVDPRQPQRAIMDTFVQKGTIFTVIGAMMVGFGLVILAATGYLAVNG